MQHEQEADEFRGFTSKDDGIAEYIHKVDFIELFEKAREDDSYQSGLHYRNPSWNQSDRLIQVFDSDRHFSPTSERDIVAFLPYIPNHTSDVSIFLSQRIDKRTGEVSDLEVFAVDTPIVMEPYEQYAYQTLPNIFQNTMDRMDAHGLWDKYQVSFSEAAATIKDSWDVLEEEVAAEKEYAAYFDDGEPEEQGEVKKSTFDEYVLFDYEDNACLYNSGDN